MNQRRTIKTSSSEKEKCFQNKVERIVASCTFISFATDGTVLHVSPGIKLLTGLSAQEMIGINWFNRRSSNDYFKRSFKAFEICRKGTYPPSFNIAKTLTDGTKLYWEIIFHPVFDKEGKVAGVEGINRDITGQKNNEFLLQKSRENVKTVRQTKRLMISKVSHELRTPLNAICGYSQLLQRDEGVPERLNKLVHAISQSCLHLQQLINETLDISHVDTGKLLDVPMEETEASVDTFEVHDKETLNNLPFYLLQGLNDALETFNLSSIETAIEEIEAINPQIAKMLSSLAKDFRYDELTELIKENNFGDN